MAAAHDGDRIIVQLGHHNVAGTTIEVNKRVLIRRVCVSKAGGRRRLAWPPHPATHT